MTKSMQNFPAHKELKEFLKVSKVMLTITFCLFLFDLILYVSSTIIQLNRDGSSWVEPVLSWEKCVLLMDYNAVTPVRLYPAAPRSQGKHSTTEPLRSLTITFDMNVILRASLPARLKCHLLTFANRLETDQAEFGSKSAPCFIGHD